MDEMDVAAVIAGYAAIRGISGYIANLIASKVEQPLSTGIIRLILEVVLALLAWFGDKALKYGKMIALGGFGAAAMDFVELVNK